MFQSLILCISVVFLIQIELVQSDFNCSVSDDGCSSCIHVCIQNLHQTQNQIEKLFKSKDIIEIHFNPGKTTEYSVDGNTFYLFDLSNSITAYGIFIYFFVTSKGRHILQYPADADSILSCYTLQAGKSVLTVNLTFNETADFSSTLQQWKNGVNQIAKFLFHANLAKNELLDKQHRYMCNYVLDLKTKDIPPGLYDYYYPDKYFLPEKSWNYFDTICYDGQNESKLDQGFFTVIVFALCVLIMYTFPLIAVILPVGIETNTRVYQEYDTPFSLSMLWLSYLNETNVTLSESYIHSLREINCLMPNKKFKFGMVLLMFKCIRANFSNLIKPMCKKILIILWLSVGFNLIVQYVFKRPNNPLQDALVTHNVVSYYVYLIQAYTATCFLILYSIIKEFAFNLHKVKLAMDSETTAKLYSKGSTEKQAVIDCFYKESSADLKAKCNETFFGVPENLVYSVKLLTVDRNSRCKIKFVEPLNTVCQQPVGMNLFCLRYIQLINNTIFSYTFWCHVFRISFKMSSQNDIDQTNVKEIGPQVETESSSSNDENRNRNSYQESLITSRIINQHQFYDSITSVTSIDSIVVIGKKESEEIPLLDLMSYTPNDTYYNANIRKLSIIGFCLSLVWPVVSIARYLLLIIPHLLFIPIFIFNLILIVLQNIPICILFKAIFYLLLEKMRRYNSKLKIVALALFTVLYFTIFPVYYFTCLRITFINSFNILIEMFFLTFFVGIPFYPEHAVAKLLLYLTLMKVLIQTWSDFQEIIKVLFDEVVHLTAEYNPNLPTLPKTVFAYVYRNAIIGTGTIALLFIKIILIIAVFHIASDSFLNNDEVPSPKTWEIILSSSFLFFTPELIGKIIGTPKRIKHGHIKKIVGLFLKEPRNIQTIKDLFEEEERINNNP